jgi:hypothetical protein
MKQYFQFEADFVDSLRCIPMTVRFKLDTCGVKLQLHHWQKFSLEERQSLLDFPCSSGAEIPKYRSHLQGLVQAYTGELPGDVAVSDRPEWQREECIPDSVQGKTQAMGEELTLEQWAKLTPIQRFVLIKLSRSHHENKNFLPALQEFLEEEPLAQNLA